MLSLLKEIELPTELAKLKDKGWIESNRGGDTGIGKTIEDHLGIDENNLGEPDCLYRGMEIEIKARRMSTSAMITLFTLEPGVRHLSDVQLMQTYGYIDAKGKASIEDYFNTQYIHKTRFKVTRGLCRRYNLNCRYQWS